MPNKPHILLITTDELRKDSLSCYGQKAIATPHIDALAAQGTQFDNAYTASPVCLPSRCSMATGLLPHNNRSYSNFRNCPLDPKIPNIYTQLKLQGYYTAHVGKCHFAPEPDIDEMPGVTHETKMREFLVTLGMDHLDLQNGKMASVLYYDDYSRELDAAGFLAAHRDRSQDRLATRRIFAFPGPDEWHPDAWVGRKAVEHILRQGAAKPQFTWVSFSGPHYPFDAPASYYKRVNVEKLDPLHYKEGEFDQQKIQAPAFHGGGEKMSLAESKNCAPGKATKNYPPEYWREIQKTYLANVALIDDQVGAILQAARKTYGDNLLVIFTTDHGEMLGNHRLWGKNSCCYQDVLNVPFIAQFPRQKRHESNSARIILPDIMPTCLNLAGAPLPPLDGRDIRTSMQDGGYAYIISETDGLVAVTDGKFKYIHFQQKGRTVYEFYDLVRDPHEFDNIIDSPAAVSEVNRLRGILASRFIDDFLR